MQVYKFIPSRQSESHRCPARSFHSATVAFLLLTLFVASCSFEIHKQGTPLQAPIISTATFPATFTPQPSETPLPSPPQPTAPRAIPVEGTTSTQVNVRLEPSTASNVL